VQSRNQFFATTAVFLLLVSIGLAAVVVNSDVTSHPKNEPTPTTTPSATLTPTAEPTETPVPTPSAMPTPDASLIIFSDGFQSSNMNAWTSTDASGVDLSVKNQLLQCQTHTSTNDSWGYLHKLLDRNYSAICWRWYMYFANLPSTNGNIIGAGGIYNSNIEQCFNPADLVCGLEVIQLNGAWYWHMFFNDNSNFRDLTSTQQVHADTWYLVELKAKQGAGDGEVRFYLNDVETLAATGLTNSNNAGIDHVSIGGGITVDQPITWYYGGAVAAQTYVSTEQSQTPQIGALLLLAIPVIVFKIHRKGIS
jgi:hypothetical protein